MALNSYWFSAPASGSQPYLYPAPTASQQPPVTVPLDQVFGAPPTGTLPAAAPFALARADAPFSYRITAGPAVWAFDAAPIRPGVRAGFDGFLAALDAQRLKGGRLHLIRGWLAQCLPQTFAESLYFRYGLDPARRCVELSPGMRLRVDFQSHQSVDPGTSSLNGFVTTGRGSIDIGQLQGAQGGTDLGFDPFLSRLQGLTVGASAAGVGGLVDVQGPAYQLPYWRLHYPAGYPSSDGTGFAAAARNPVLIGAATRAVLEAASAEYVAEGTVPAPAVGVWFRGRATPVPEIPILLQNELRYVTLGTTLRGLLAGFGPIPWVPGMVPTQFLSRLGNQLLGSSSAEWKLASYQPVALGSPTYTTYSDTLDCFDLPLVGGDSISFPITG